MAINPCKECSGPVSDKAESCPMCGAKQLKKTSRLVMVFGVVLLGFIFWNILKDDSETTSVEPSPERKALAAKASTIRVVSEALKDPDSAKFEFLNENCGTVNSKNSFGGYVGIKRFVSVGGIVDLEGHSVSNKEMDDLWKKHCS